MFFAILVSLFLVMIIPIYKSHNNVTGGTINYDSAMRKFVYKVNLSGEDIISLLKTKNDADELACDFDLDKSVIKFTEYSSYRKYFFQIKEYNGFSVLRLEQVELIGMQSHIPYKLNPFMASKLKAEIIPFSQHGF